MDSQLQLHYGHVFEKELLVEISTIGIFKEMEAGEKLIEIGAPINYMPLLLEGAIKILREDKKEEELVLYFLERGDTCAITLNCCVNNATSEIRAITETKTRVVMNSCKKNGTLDEQVQNMANFCPR